MQNQRLAQWILTLALSATLQVSLFAQGKPEAGGPALSSSAKLSPATLATAATSTGSQQQIALLRFASDEMQRQSSRAATDWVDIARDQGILKDIEGLNSTVAYLQKALDAETDADIKSSEAADSWPVIAGAYAWAGSKELSEKYAARVPKDAEPESLARMRAQMGNLAGVDATLALLDDSDRDFAYGSIAEQIWIGDPVMGESLLKRIKDTDGKQDDFVATYYANAGEIQKALAIAKVADNPYYWICIAKAYEEKQDFEGAKAAKADYLKSIARKPDAAQKSRFYVTFNYQMELEKPDVPAATCAKMAKYALAMMEVADKDWKVAAGEAACAAARLGDEATVTSIVDAAGKMPNDKRQRDFVADAVKNGRALKLLADGKAEDAITLAKSINRPGWGTWKAKEDLYRYAMIHGDLPLALKIERITGTTDMLHWVMRQQVKMQISGAALDGKPVDVFAFIAARTDPYDRSEAALAVAEELLRRRVPTP